MNFIELLSIIGSIASIISFFISIFTVYKLVTIGNSISVKGDKNITVGGDAKKLRG
ncbi:hypothetical protein VU07_00680 [Desulfobulbus sp. F4]|nr:hypothetical protein [Desulfobulbus sp. F4]